MGEANLKLAICLLTADRPDYTHRTLTSLRIFAEMSTSILLHADDGSISHANRDLAKHAGFETVYSSKIRLGQGPALQAMWHEAVKRGATHILHLENDWEFVKPFQTVDMFRPFPGLESVRLYGEYKERDALGPRAKTGPHIIGTKEEIFWDRLWFDIGEEEWEYADEASWGGPPSITDARILQIAVQGAKTIKEISLRLPRLLTWRPRENIVWHIGECQTTEFNGAK